MHRQYLPGEWKLTVLTQVMAVDSSLVQYKKAGMVCMKKQRCDYQSTSLFFLIFFYIKIHPLQCFLAPKDRGLY